MNKFLTTAAALAAMTGFLSMSSAEELKVGDKAPAFRTESQ
ncbi:MAG: hypothetical protein R3C49_19680 [Planctomycetaceae bacterium]